jgi:pimeloyl-ACP methyl ester carboxylesterase
MFPLPAFSRTASAEAAPPLPLLLGEARVARDWAMARWRPRADAVPRVGRGEPVLTLPGFLAGDVSMAQMRQTLNAAGFRAKRWKQGPNMGAKADTLERIDEAVRRAAHREGRPVHIVGWSLGGLFAREYAKHHPEHVASVITMGTPFSGSRRANHAWRLYQLVARHDVDAPPVPFHPAAKPPVPTFALWSRRDGVIAVDSARGTDVERDRAVELDCGHIGFAYAPEAVRAVIDCLLAAEGR